MSTPPTDIGTADAAGSSPGWPRPSLAFGPMIDAVAFIVFMATILLLAASIWVRRE